MGLPTHFSLDSRRTGDVSVVSAFGDIDIATYREVESALAASRDGGGALVLDLRGVEFMDTSGLRLVVQERQRADANGYQFVVVRGPRNVQRLFEIAGLKDADGFVDTPPELTGGTGP